LVLKPELLLKPAYDQAADIGDIKELSLLAALTLLSLLAVDLTDELGARNMLREACWEGCTEGREVGFPSLCKSVVLTWRVGRLTGR
jgi:hypothetical protein